MSDSPRRVQVCEVADWITRAVLVDPTQIAIVELDRFPVDDPDLLADIIAELPDPVRRRVLFTDGTVAGLLDRALEEDL